MVAIETRQRSLDRRELSKMARPKAFQHSQARMWNRRFIYTVLAFVQGRSLHCCVILGFPWNHDIINRRAHQEVTPVTQYHTRLWNTVDTHCHTLFQQHARVIRFNRRLNSQVALPKVVLVMVTSPQYQGDCWGKKAERFPGSLSACTSLYCTCLILPLPPRHPLPWGRAVKPIKYSCKDPLLPISVRMAITLLQLLQRPSFSSVGFQTGPC